MRERSREHRALTRTISAIAGLIALAVGILLPAGYLLRAYYLERTGMAAEAELYALRVTELVNRNPGMWHFELERIGDVVDRDLVETDHIEVRRVFDREGRLIMASKGRLPSPVMTAHHEFYDSGEVVGRIEIARSMLIAWQRAMAVAVFSFGLGFAVFIALRVLPLRALDRALESLASEKDRLRVVVDNAMDGIFSLDQSGGIESFNAAAESMFGYAASEVVGQPIEILLPDLDPAELEDADAEGGLLGEGEGLRRDGSRFPLEYAISRAEDAKGYRVIGIVRDITERRQAQEALSRLANYDSLTGLPNRNLFRDRLQRALARAKRNGQLVALIFLDLDRFKNINDTLGHTVGDELLQTVAKRIRYTLRETDSVGHLDNENGSSPKGVTEVSRLGGDEFTIILENIGHPDNAAPVARRILDAIASPIPLAGRSLYVSASAGISVYPNDDPDPENLLKNADSAMYRAKDLGRNNYQFFSEELNRQAHERLDMELRLRNALANSEFSLHFQPQLDIRSYRSVAVEALLRWNSPELGSVSPAKFIPVLEETGLIVEVGAWVLETACGWARGWQDAGLPPVRVGVNISARQFRQGDLVAVVERALQGAGLAPEWLELEITESLLMEHSEAVIDTLNTLGMLGIRISVDDFGTGYSSLAYLKRFPIHALKIDLSFVRDVNTDTNDAAIAQAIIALGRSLGLSVVAEGVENAEQLAFLVRGGCDEIQGYLLSRPLPPGQLERWYAVLETQHLPAMREFAGADPGLRRVRGA